MKKLLHCLIISTLALCFACDNDNGDDYKTYKVSIQLTYPEGYTPAENIAVKLTSSSNVYDATTTNIGIAEFTVPAGIYDASATDVRTGIGSSEIFGGIKSGITITSAWNESTEVELNLVKSTVSQIVIKELYNGGCQKDNDAGTFQNDKYVILYNNSNYPANLSNICLGFVNPYNSNATNNDYIGGELVYKNDNWIPAGDGFWYFSNTLELAPGEQIVVNMTGAIDNTQTFSKSINFSNPDYYCCYDIEVFTNLNYYPAPASVIPSSHYLKAAKINGVKSNAWALSVSSPAFYIFNPQETTITDFVSNTNYDNLYGTNQYRKKVPANWIVDGIEVFRKNETNRKRLTDVVDAGYVELSSFQGYTLYRNVDENATKAIEGNEAKLVYRYTMGTADISGTTDPSGIDAEASAKNGARIIYKDTNNSTNDFHQRKKASIKE